MDFMQVGPVRIFSKKSKIPSSFVPNLLLASTREYFESGNPGFSEEQVLQHFFAEKAQQEFDSFFAFAQTKWVQMWHTDEFWSVYFREAPDEFSYLKQGIIKVMGDAHVQMNLNYLEDLFRGANRQKRQRHDRLLKGFVSVAKNRDRIKRRPESEFSSTGQLSIAGTGDSSFDTEAFYQSLIREMPSGSSGWIQPPGKGGIHRMKYYG